MNILFVHINFPAQFRHLYNNLSQNPDINIKFLAESMEWTNSNLSKSDLVKFSQVRPESEKICHPNLKRFEKAVLKGQSCLKEAIKLNEQGFKPDIIIGHSGFGATLYLKELWPKSKFLGYFEWFYKTSGSDVGFGSRNPLSPSTASRIVTYNAPILMDLAVCDAGITPTKWQADQFPKKFNSTLNIIHDGINTDFFKPRRDDDMNKPLVIDSANISIEPTVPLVTYTTRGFESYRGWPQVAEGISILLQQNQQVHVLLVGSDEVAYGSKRSDGKSWRQWANEEFDYDLSRVHFCPPLQYDEYLKVLQYSWVHIYWTIPFILSWGLLESMSTGCSIVASNTEPVREVISSGVEGILVDFFNPEDMAGSIINLLNDEPRRISLGENARQKIFNDGFDLKSCLNKQKLLIKKILS